MTIDSTRISDLALGKLSPEDSLRLLEEIERDPGASADLEARVRLHAHVREGGEFLFVPPDRVRDRPALHSRQSRWWRPRVAAYAMAFALLVVAVAAPVVDALTRGPFADIAAVEYPRYEAVLRSAGDSDIDLAVRMLRGGHPREALLLLERFCRAYPESDLREYAHYLAGSIYLLEARRSVLGMFVSYEPRSVQAGLAHLDDALQLAGNPIISEESRWLRAKALLMLERPQEAIAELDAVLGLPGDRRADALELRRILSEE